MIIKAFGIETSHNGPGPDSNTTFVVDTATCDVAYNTNGMTQVILTSLPAGTAPIGLWDPDLKILDQIQADMMKRKDQWAF
jgi:hypothetical protein